MLGIAVSYRGPRAGDQIRPWNRSIRGQSRILSCDFINLLRESASDTWCISQHSMATILFVHGTGVRKPSYLVTFALLQAALDEYSGRHKLEPCLWGDDLGSKPPSLSLPVPISRNPSIGSPNREQESARWELLYRDPIFELCLLKNRPRATEPMPPNAPRPGKALWSRIEVYAPSNRVEQFLQKWHLDPYWAAAWHFVIRDNHVAKEVLDSSSEEIGEPGQAIARAVVASLLNQATEDGRPIVDGPHRDQLVELLVEDWKAKVAGIGTFLLGFFSDLVTSVATPIVRWKRGDLSEAASPSAGDVLLYQARGEGIRRYILRRIEDIDSDVVLLTHSLGGIACVDLLVGRNLPKVKGLITVGSQASLLKEIGALCSLEPGVDVLPECFPKWLNIYDPNDFLSYVAEPVFKNEKISDFRVESGQPFPHSHGAYWTNPKTWAAIVDFLR
jgi:hypothetical protein